MAEFKHLLINREDNVAIVTLNRAKQFNTLNHEVWQEIHDAARAVEEMGDIRAVVINAAGDNFSAGLDVNYLSQGSSEHIMKNANWLQSIYTVWEDFPVPVIAAVQGICYGGATEFILACDIRIAAANARIAIPEVRFGLAPDMGGTTRLPKLVGPGQAKRLILACEEIDAEEAKAIGLVEVVVETEKLMERALKMAHKIAGMPPVAVYMGKKGINLAAESSRRAGLLFEGAQSVYCCGTDDMKEAVSAFFEKRKPEFKGR
ncbi:MAG: enoyl-CoA hydratase/isomerase family protein [Syntrophomonadaceae bacterium]|nr:enoyl-CoA hydratase/isomerase family protein [Syntrophomonadaceae bacterium]